MRTLLIALFGALSILSSTAHAENTDYQIPDYSSWPSLSNTCRNGTVTITVYGILNNRPVTEYHTGNTRLARITSTDRGMLYEIYDSKTNKTIYLPTDKNHDLGELAQSLLNELIEPDITKRLEVSLICFTVEEQTLNDLRKQLIEAEVNRGKPI